MKKYLTSIPDLAQMIDVFDELPIWSAPFGMKLLDYIEYKPGITALDIGFGAGFPLTEIALRLGESSVVYGIDPWKEAAERTRKKIMHYGLANVNLIEGVAESIPLANATVALITSNNGINNVNNMELVFAECCRIMKPGGQFIQTMNTDLTMIEFYDQLEFVLKSLRMESEIDQMHRHIALKRPPVESISALLRKNGFRVKDLVQDQFCYKFTDGTAMLNHYFIRLAFMDSWIKLLPGDKVEQVFDSVESRLNEQSFISGGLKLSVPFVLINAYKQ